MVCIPCTVEAAKFFMYSYFQLLIRNTLLGLAFCIGITIIVFITASDYLKQKQTEHRQLIYFVISNIVDQRTINDNSTTNISTTNMSTTQNKNTNYLKEVELFAETINKNDKYNLLSISNAANETIFNYDNYLDHSYLDPKKKRFQFYFINPKPISTLLTTPRITIKFQLNSHTESIFILQFLTLIFTCTCVFIIIASYSSFRRYKILFSGVTQQITKNTALQSLHHNASSPEQVIHIEPLTQLDNRSRFVQFFENNVIQGSLINFGVLTITRCSELPTINQIHGHHEGDNYILKVAEIMKATIEKYPSGQLFRLNNSDFASIIPNVNLKEAEHFAQELTKKFNKYQQDSALDSIAYTGLVYFDKSSPLGELLALADTGISIAQTKHINAWYSQKDIDILQNKNASIGNQNWRQEIDSVIENQRINLLVQRIEPNTGNNKVYDEIIARFLNSNNEMLPTASFIAMAEKLDKIVAIDKLIIETAIDIITDKNTLNHSYGITINSRSIHDDHFLIWLERRLLRDTNIPLKLIFEITEDGLQQNLKTSKRFIDMIYRVGSRLTVKSFGVGLTSFKFFRDLKPDFIKIDSTYTRDIDEDKNNQYFLRLMVDLAHRLSIQVLAEGVENKQEKSTLEKLFIDGCQGFYIGKPEGL